MDETMRRTLCYILPMAVSALLLVFMLIRTEYSLGRRQQIRCFRLMLMGCITCMCSTILYYAVSSMNLTDNSIFCHILVVLMYLPMSFAAMNWANFAASTTHFSWQDSRWWKILSIMPLEVMLLFLLSPYYRTLVIRDSNGDFSAGFGESVAIAIDVVYLGMALVIGIIGRGTAHGRSEKRMNGALFGTFFLTLLGEFLSMLFPFLPMYELCLTAGIFIIYSELLTA